MDCKLSIDATQSTITLYFSAGEEEQGKKNTDPHHMYHSTGFCTISIIHFVPCLYSAEMNTDFISAVLVFATAFALEMHSSENDSSVADDQK